ncbi:allantoate amidohydrolase [Microbacterium horticulturae]|uniref:Allantoate amidohydrolase n=1 Tax=Microbacterium horticulturae TaxID=3028316 RepID=A0ABY8C0L4_9MICO|nr:allantoate amidohydrolase [Microbacterium sp. KACC 23027]WEG09949.1 allantoate amidohydrolase [Microbacterium sp. KACC 23027]
MTVTARLAEIAELGRDAERGGYSRHLFDAADAPLRDWFRRSASALGLAVEEDGDANLWAWWGEAGSGVVATGSHIDSVPGGGAYDGPLGIAAAFEAVAQLQAEGFTPARPVAVCAFAEEEGSRFGLPCLGTRLLTGATDAATALERVDAAGTTLADAWRASGRDVAAVGADPERIARLAAFVELHVEQGRDLEDRGIPISTASAIIPHGRWRLEVTGSGNHAGTTTMDQRADPVVAAARVVLAVQQEALSRPPARGTIGKVQVIPGGTNVIASRVVAWLDLRADRDDDVRALFEAVLAAAREGVEAEGCTLDVHEESFTARVDFDAAVTARVAAALRPEFGEVPAIPTGAGHDAGILAAHVPTAMLFVRNPTGVSHAPGESARDEDCEAGATALAAALRELAGGA